MKRTFRIGAAILFAAMNTTTAFAALSDSALIETPNVTDETVRSLDAIISSSNPLEMTGSLLNSYKHSSQPAAALLDGNSIGQTGSGQITGESRTDRQPAPQLGASSAPDLFMYASHPVSSSSSAYQYASTSDMATSVSVNSITAQTAETYGSPSVISGTVTATPLPAAGLLLASGLLSLPLFNLRRKESV